MRKVDLATAVTIGMNIWNITDRARDLYRGWDDSRYYSVSVPEGVSFYFDLMKIIHSGEVKGKNFKLAQAGSKVHRLYDSDKESLVNIAGHDFLVCVTNLNDIDNDSVLHSGLASRIERGLVFRTKSIAAIEALEGYLSDMLKQKMNESIVPYLWIPSSGYWNQTSLPVRDIDSVILKDGEKEAIIADLEGFIESEDEYLRMGIPWHRGYMLHGPPGNGKSSLIMALAHKLRRHVYVLSLSGIKDDETLNELISAIRKESFVIIEDIDVFSDFVTRDGGSTGLTLAGLLNALDGVFTPHGMVTFMTTNRLEILDEALVRPGRVDYRLHLTAPNAGQIERAFKHVYGEPLLVTPREFSSMAEFIDIVKRNQRDSVAARAEIGNDFEEIVEVED